MNRCCLLRGLGAALIAALLAGCPVRPHVPAPAATPLTPAAHAGTRYDIDTGASLLTVLVYRGGTLASAGHNHVIASHQLSGAVYVPGDALHASFEVHIPVDTLTVDEQELRARELSPDFPPDVPDSARQGTRRNMLGPALLDGAQHAEIVLRALSLQAQATAGGAAGRTVLARVLTEVRGQQRAVEVPVSYQQSGTTLEISAQFPLRQTDLGLTPFTAMLGALAVQDEMRVRIRLVTHAARGG
ncbi:MAG TPA: YceI family protein [Steroidobacteraceae bacterium]|nr:YceI family protein [Steroidobacteraceae bacterium]